MDACLAVEKEVDRVLSKFGNISEHADRVIADLIAYIENINSELQQGECTFTRFPRCLKKENKEKISK